VRETPRPVRLQRRCDPTTGAAPRILLLHGMANNSGVWDRLCAEAGRHPLVRSAELWSADLPWRAGGPADWSHRPDATGWLAETLTELRAVAGPADLVVAHSYAATMTLDLLTTPAAAQDVRGALLISPFFRPTAADFSWATVTGLAEKFQLTMVEGIRVMSAGRGNPALHPAMAQRVCEEIGPYGWARFLELYLRTPWMPAGDLARPVLVAAGDADVVADPAEGAALAARLPQGTFRLLAGAGHFPMVEQTGAVLDLIGELAGHLGRPVAAGDPYLPSQSMERT
jgi:pimeloyl-ACP methyl ester carboxylesterase